MKAGAHAWPTVSCRIFEHLYFSTENPQKTTFPVVSECFKWVLLDKAEFGDGEKLKTGRADMKFLKTYSGCRTIKVNG